MMQKDVIRTMQSLRRPLLVKTREMVLRKGKESQECRHHPVHFWSYPGSLGSTPSICPGLPYMAPWLLP